MSWLRKYNSGPKTWLHLKPNSAVIQSGNPEVCQRDKADRDNKVLIFQVKVRRDNEQKLLRRFSGLFPRSAALRQ